MVGFHWDNHYTQVSHFTHLPPHSLGETLGTGIRGAIGKWLGLWLDVREMRRRVIVKLRISRLLQPIGLLMLKIIVVLIKVLPI